MLAKRHFAVHVPCLRVVLPGVPGCLGPCASAFETHTHYGNRARRLRHSDTGFEVFHKRCLSASVVFGWGSTLCYGARLRRGNLHLSDSADSVSYGVHGDVAPTPFNNFNTYAGCD